MNYLTMRLVMPGLCLLSVGTGLQAGTPYQNVFGYPQHFGQPYGQRPVVAGIPHRSLMPPAAGFRSVPGYLSQRRTPWEPRYAQWRFRPWPAYQPPTREVRRFGVDPRFYPGYRNSGFASVPEMDGRVRYAGPSFPYGSPPRANNAYWPAQYRFRPMPQPAYRGMPWLAGRYGAPYRWRPMSPGNTRIAGRLGPSETNPRYAPIWHRQFPTPGVALRTESAARANSPGYAYGFRPVYAGPVGWSNPGRVSMARPNVSGPAPAPVFAQLHRMRGPYPIVASRPFIGHWTPQMEWMQWIRPRYPSYTPVRFYPPGYLFAGSQGVIRQIPAAGRLSMPGRYNPMGRYRFRPAPRMEYRRETNEMLSGRREIGAPGIGDKLSEKGRNLPPSTGRYTETDQLSGLRKEDLVSSAVAQVYSPEVLSRPPAHNANHPLGTYGTFRPVFEQDGIIKDLDPTAVRQRN